MICSAPGCLKESRARGLCSNHHAQALNHGTLERVRHGPLRICSVEGCGRKYVGKGFCEKHYQESKVRNNPEKYRNIELKRKDRTHRFKREMVAWKGGKCEICGYDKNYACLDFHHSDPIAKEWTPSKLMRKTETDTIKKELGSCMLLCKNCHNDLHNPWGVNKPSAEPKEEVAP